MAAAGAGACALQREGLAPNVASHSPVHPAPHSPIKRRAADWRKRFGRFRYKSLKARQWLEAGPASGLMCNNNENRPHGANARFAHVQRLDHGAHHPLQEWGIGRGRLRPHRGLADRGRHSRARARGHDGREPDARLRRAQARHRDLRGDGAQARARDGGNGVELDRRGHRAVAVCREGRRGRRADRNAVLQQAERRKACSSISRRSTTRSTFRSTSTTFRAGRLSTCRLPPSRAASRT